MKKQILLPRKCRLAGWIAFPLALLNLYASWQWHFHLPLLYKHIFQVLPTGVSVDTEIYDYTFQAAFAVVFISIFMIAFSKEKIEDEYVRSVRLNSLLVSIYIYTGLLLVATLFSLNGVFLVYAALTIVPLLLIYIMVYNFQMHLKPMLSKTRAA